MNIESTLCSAISKPIASSASNQSKTEQTRLDIKDSEEGYWNCTKILEETDEESASNLTPRLASEEESKANELENIKKFIFIRKSADENFNKEVYASKTTLETEESSFNKYDLESIST